MTAISNQHQFSGLKNTSNPHFQPHLEVKASQTQSTPSRQSQKFGANSRFYGTNMELSQGNEGKIHEMELKNVGQSLIVPKSILDFKCISTRITTLTVYLET